MQKSILTYLLVALLLSTAVVYFVAAAGESIESEGSKESEQSVLNENDLDNDEADEKPTVTEEEGISLATPVETAFFTLVGIGYSLMSIWVLKDKGKTNAPYVVAIAGSIAIIGLYIASRTIDLPLVGLQDDIGTIDILSKVLQVGIIGGAASVINNNRNLKIIPNKQQHSK